MSTLPQSCTKNADYEGELSARVAVGTKTTFERFLAALLGKQKTKTLTHFRSIKDERVATKRGWKLFVFVKVLGRLSCLKRIDCMLHFCSGA